MFRNLSFYKVFKYFCMFGAGIGVFYVGVFAVGDAVNYVPYQASLMVFIILYGVLCATTVGAIFLVRFIFDYGQLGLIMYNEWRWNRKHRGRDQTRAHLKL